MTSAIPRWALLSVALLMLASAPAAPQASPDDSAAVLLRAAERFDADRDRSTAIAILQFILRYYPTTVAAADAQQRLGEMRRHQSEGSGHVQLVLWSTLYGTWLGLAVPAALGADQVEPFGAGLLLGGPLGFGVSQTLTRRHPLSGGQARAIVFGMLWGTWQGLGWKEALDLFQRTEVFCFGPPGSDQCREVELGSSSESSFSAMIVGSLAGLSTGILLANSRDISGGSATMTSVGALFGTWYGAASAVLFDVDGEDGALTWTLIGGNIGLLTTALLAPKWNMTSGRASLIAAGGLAGLVGGLGFSLLFDPQDNQFIALPLLGSAVGLGAAAVATRHQRDADRGGVDGLGALLDVRDGQWTFGLPTPIPDAVLVDDPRSGPRWKPGARITLVSVQF